MVQTQEHHPYTCCMVYLRPHFKSTHKTDDHWRPPGVREFNSHSCNYQKHESPYHYPVLHKLIQCEPFKENFTHNIFSYHLFLIFNRENRSRKTIPVKAPMTPVVRILKNIAIQYARSNGPK